MLNVGLQLKKFFVMYRLVPFLALLVSTCLFGQISAISENEQWVGNWIWYQNEGCKNQRPCLVRVHEWIRKYPCSWGMPMVNHIIGECSNVGLKDVIWVVAEKDKLYYPSKLWPESVYRNLNSGYDFSELDIPKLALSVANADSADISLAVIFDDYDFSLMVCKELLAIYPNAKLLLINNSKTNVPEFKNATFAHRVKCINGYDKKNFINVSDYYMTSYEGGNKYAGKLIFKRDIFVTDKPKKCLISLTAQDEYYIWINGIFVGFDSSWRRGEVYDVTSLVKKGKNVFLILASNKSEKNHGGFLANIRLDNEVLPCDDKWRVKPFIGEFDLPNVPKDAFVETGWSKPLIMSRGNVWPNYRLVKNNWSKIKPLIKDSNVAWIGKGVQILSKYGKNGVGKVIDGDLADSSIYQTKSLDFIELSFPDTTEISEIILHTGYLEWADNPSGVCSAKRYRLWYKKNHDSEWEKISQGDILLEPYKGQKREFFGAHYKFAPLSVVAVAVEFLSSWDTGCRVRSPLVPVIPENERVIFIREIEVLASNRTSVE